jgi:hypothetical protein
MNDPQDPMSRLRAANPVRAEDAPAADSPQARALYERIVSTPVSERAPYRRPFLRRNLKVLVPIVAIAVAAAGYGVYRSVSQPLDIACYGQMSIAGDVVGVAATGGDPVALCRALWRSGGSFNPDGGRPAPALTACVREGTLVVLPHPPGMDPCAALGLAHPERGGLSADQERLLRVEEALAVRFLSPHCVPEASALAAAQAELRAEGLEGWRVTVAQPFAADRPCASAAYDPDSKTILLVPTRTTSP